MESTMAGYDRLIDDIYSVVADPARWPGLLTTVSDEIGTLGGMAAYVNLGRAESMMEIGRLSPVFAKVYANRYVANPWNKAMQRLVPNRQVVMMSSITRRSGAGSLLVVPVPLPPPAFTSLPRAGDLHQACPTHGR
jgi:hypothetical protein